MSWESDGINLEGSDDVTPTKEVCVDEIKKPKPVPKKVECSPMSRKESKPQIS